MDRLFSQPLTQPTVTFAHRSNGTTDTDTRCRTARSGTRATPRQWAAKTGSWPSTTTPRRPSSDYYARIKATRIDDGIDVGLDVGIEVGLEVNIEVRDERRHTRADPALTTT